MAYDLCIRNLEFHESARLAGMLGWKGVCFLLPEGQKPARVKHGLDTSFGIEINPMRASEVGTKAKASRRSTEIIAVCGGTPEVNRAAVECPEVDVLFPWGSPQNPVQERLLNHVMVKLARDNSVHIGLDFHSLLFSHRSTRSVMLSRMGDAARLLTKYRAPFLLTSGARNPWDIRSPSELSSFARVLGLKDPAIKDSLAGHPLKENRRRLSGEWLMPGVERINTRKDNN